MIDIRRQKADLHIHTCYSDGEAEPASIVKTAARLGYDVIAVTDHDNFGGVREAVETGRREGLEVITGIELAAETEEGIGLHILGYGMDIDNPELAAAVGELSVRRHRRNVKLLEVLEEKGCPVSLEELESRQPGGFVGKPVIARAMVEKGYINDYKEAFEGERFFGSPEARAVRKEKLSASSAIALINGAGGTAVFAHPIQTKHIGQTGSDEFYKNIEKIIRRLKEQGLGGIECCHPDQDDMQTERFVRLAEKYGLCITRGSDFHGADFAEAEHTADISHI